MISDILGLQLYTVRDELNKNFNKIIESIAEIGYKYIEFAGFYGKSAIEIKNILNDNGLKSVSAHINYFELTENTQKTADFLSKIGIEYAVISNINAEYLYGGDKYTEFLKKIEQSSGILKNSGIKLLYHNHDFEFKKFNNIYKLDDLYNRLSHEILQAEPDTGWIQYAGLNASKYLLNKLFKRCPLVHLKDYTLKPNSEIRFESLGQGIVNVEDIISASIKAGCKYLIVEQDYSEKIPVMKSIKQSYEYIKNLNINKR